MENKTQNQPNNKGKASKSKKYDIFISYRHLGKDDHDHRHSTSLARSLAQEFEQRGFSVFFDCWNTPEECHEALNNSEYFIILVTKYSFDTKEKGGEFFKEELQRIKEIIDKTDSKKDHVFLLEVDKAYDNKNSNLMAALQKFIGTDLKGKIRQLLTDQSFSDWINQLIKKPEHEGEKRIGKPSKLSNERYKRYRPAFIITLITMLCALIMESVFFGINQKKLEEDEGIIKQRDSIIEQYKNECIVFAGGGTVQKYLALNHDIDVSNYTDYPSKYIHLPSAEAWSLLWDEITETDNGRQYWPIVLSAEKLDDSLHIGQLKSSIVEYKLGAIPLMVQIHGDFKEKSICLKELQKLLNNPSYAVHTTSDHSGTYNAYHQALLDSCKYDLDSLKKNGQQNVFTLSHYDTAAQGKPNHVLLGNSLYNYQNDKGSPLLPLIPVVYDAQTQEAVTLPLYVYTVAVRKDKSGDTNYRELCSQVNDFLYRIGCDTTQDITYIKDSIVEMNSRKR